jgi:hypothetical protein
MREKNNIPQREKFNIVKMSTFPDLIYRFSAISIKISASYSVDINKLILRFVERQRTQNSQHIVEEQNSMTA